MARLSNYQKIYSWILFIALILICNWLYRDYGLSWDEPAQWEIAKSAYKYIVNGDPHYLQAFDRIYGLGFELPVYCLELIFQPDGVRETFMFRHFVYFLFFSYACFLFFRMNMKLFRSTLIALVPTAMLVLTPRIFGHAFMNSKDIPYLSMTIICFYTIHLYILKANWKNLLLMGISIGLLINFRILGVMILVIASIIIFIKWIKEANVKAFIHPMVLIFLSGLTLYATWPFLWTEPVVHFKFAFKTMSKFLLATDVLFKGELIRPGQRTIEYLFTWIAISLPLLYMITSITGVFYFVVKSIKDPAKFLSDHTTIMGAVFMAGFICPVAAIIYFDSALYDDWRQLYFIWPSVLVFSGYLLYFIHQRSNRISMVISGALFLYMGYMLVTIVRLHPYEHVYFNEFVSKEKDFLQKNYEQDYWGTSYYEGLRFICRNDKNDIIWLRDHNYPLERNCWMMNEQNVKRIRFTSEPTPGSYYLTTLRANPTDSLGHEYTSVVFEIKRQNSVILRIWKK